MHSPAVTITTAHAVDRPPFVLERVSRESFLRRVRLMQTTPVDPACFQPATSPVSGFFTNHTSPAFGSASAETPGSAQSKRKHLLPPGVVPLCEFVDFEQEPKFHHRGHSFHTASVTGLCETVHDDGGDLWSVNTYNIIAPLGQGSCGTVHLVELVGSAGIDFSIGHEFGLKAIPRDAKGQERAIANEAAMMMLLNGHPHIVTLYEVIDDPEEDTLFLVMDYVEGGAIATVDAETGKSSTTLDATEMAAFVTQQASALTYVHAKGMVHGDYKAENVLFTGARGAGLQTKLADFGVSVLQEEAAAAKRALSIASPRRRKSVVGTPYTRSPEAFAGESATAGDDAWAFGVVLHTLVTGRIPFAADNLAGMAAAVGAGLPGAPAATDPPLSHVWWGVLSRLLCPTSPAVRLAELHRISLPLPTDLLNPPALSLVAGRRQGIVLPR